ncbi:MAG: gluconeogenesis factor YvcK family protein [Anaerovoracaceae bacterium]|jgi:uncharacterized cofD-like protein
MNNRYGSNQPKIVVIGGGTGLSVILRGIKKVTENLTAVVTVADNGGGSGVLREDLGMLPPGDIRSCISALAKEEGLMQELLKYRFTDGRLEGQCFGNLLIAALNGMFGNFEMAVSKASEILKITGRVIPVTGSDVHLCAELENGSRVVGESQIPSQVLKEKSPIKSVYLTPDKPTATEEALVAIRKADMIIMGPGSLFTSIIPNLLVDGICEAISCSMSKKVFICNMMTQPGETDNYTVWQHADRIMEFIGEKNIEYIIANNKLISQEILAPYSQDGSKQIVPTDEDRNEMKKHDIVLIENNFIDIKHGYIRHDADRIANVIHELIHTIC